MKKAVLCFVVIFLLLVPAGLCYDSVDGAYEAMLTKLIRVSVREPDEEQLKLLDDSRLACLRFSQDHPDSVYADDSRFIYGLVEFLGALIVPPRDLDGAAGMVSFMEKTIDLYPEGEVEELTYSILRRELGQEAVGGVFYIPYSHIVEYMRGLMAFHTRDYNGAIEGFERLKKSGLSPLEDEGIALEIYVPLYISYIRSGRTRDARALEGEAAGLYPGSLLEETLKQIDARESN
ncbi:MAG: hypothetical protein MUC52_01010, partial [Candidatus Omnitrophica bacterium]|nr:hypothetical protein [Candidatus Omnitrophota bacterium]